MNIANTTTGSLTVSGAFDSAGIVRFTNTTPNISLTTGSVLVSGGLGINGAMTAKKISIN